MRGFTEALRAELEARRCGVSATTVHPGGVRTEIARRARVDPEVPGGPDRVRRQFDRVARTPPDRAARRILRGVERNERRVLIGADAVAIDLLSRLPAGLYGWALAAVYRRNLKG